ncbi:MAG: GNAT family N-acetyltransferase [Treponema sp.]|nr:GNAT family N-acetyltransferase [Treponema sp.]
MDNGELINDATKLFREHNSKEYIWWGLDEKWESIVENNFSVKTNDFPRYEWKFNRSIFTKLPEIEAYYKIEKINENNVEKMVVQNHNPITNFWDSIEMFLEKGFGFFLSLENVIASLIFSAGVYKNEVEIDIVTNENYRNKGLGKVLSKRFINECLSRNLLPKWDCYKFNESSICLAKRLGFEIIKEYPVKQIIFEKSDKCKILF